MRLFPLTLLCMIFFSLNSVLCRLALVTWGMEPLAYTAIRDLSAATMLGIICAFSALAGAKKGKEHIWKQAMAQSSWKGAMLLFLYMLTFSLSYVAIPSAAGTLILNVAVQVSMIGWGLMSGMRPGRPQIAGLLLAFAGAAILLLPGVSAPSPLHALLMGMSGVFWGAYCLCGRKASSAQLATSGNFLRSAPMGLIAALAALTLESAPSLPALTCAVLAGAVASGLGYTLWYALVPRYSILGASVVQLSIPPITAVLGAILLAEPITMRLVFCTLLILGGILLTLKPRS